MEIPQTHIVESTKAPIVVPSRITSDTAEGRLARRFRRDERKEEITYEFTDDPALLHQYYRLRVEMYRKVLHVNVFDENEDKHDRISHILIARKGKLCVGGCRLTVREPGEDFLLPLENENFLLKKLFPEHGLATLAHGEFSRFAVLEEFSTKDVMYQLSSLVIQKAIDLKLAYTFARSTYALARHWRKIGTIMGLHTTDILTHLDIPPVPGYPEMKMYLSISKMPGANQKKLTHAALKTLV